MASMDVDTPETKPDVSQLEGKTKKDKPVASSGGKDRFEVKKVR
jgi:hypothetical protein